MLLLLSPYTLEPGHRNSGEACVLQGRHGTAETYWEMSSEQGRRKEPNKTQICKCSHKSPRSSSQSQNAANLSYLFLPHHQQLEESQIILFSQLKDQANISSKISNLNIFFENYYCEASFQLHFGSQLFCILWLKGWKHWWFEWIQLCWPRSRDAYHSEPHTI